MQKIAMLMNCCIFHSCSYSAGLVGSLMYMRMLGNSVDSMQSDGPRALIKYTFDCLSLANGSLYAILELSQTLTSFVSLCSMEAIDASENRNPNFLMHFACATIVQSEFVLEKCLWSIY